MQALVHYANWENIQIWHNHAIHLSVPFLFWYGKSNSDQKWPFERYFTIPTQFDILTHTKCLYLTKCFIWHFFYKINQLHILACILFLLSNCQFLSDLDLPYQKRNGRLRRIHLLSCSTNIFKINILLRRVSLAQFCPLVRGKLCQINF